MSGPDGICVDTSQHTMEMEGSCEDIIEETDCEFVRLKHLANWPPVNIHFQDITQIVPDVTCGEYKGWEEECQAER